MYGGDGVGKGMKGNLPLIVITGPTATGKSKVGVLVAQLLGGEIISADSMLVYRGLDIGTAKPTKEEMGGIPHHLIDIVNPDEDYNVALYQKQARKAISEILSKNKIPVMVGGTGLYIRAVVDGFEFAGGKPDLELRRALWKEAMEKGPDKLHERLWRVDPCAALKIHPRNIKRVVRALEVYMVTGKPFSSYHKEKNIEPPPYCLRMFGLIMPRDILYRRIEERVDRMIESGLIGEVERLLKSGYKEDLNALKGLGYKEVIAYLKGDVSLEEAIETLKKNTRRFAKRQLTWFKGDKRIKWLDVSEYESYEALAKEIVRNTEGVL